MDRDHDQNFKNLILDYPRQALAFFAASEAAGIDESVTITPIRQEQLKARLGDRFRELDVPLLVEWPDGRREALLFALEEETDPKRFSTRRLINYCTDLTHLLETNRVVPVVIFLNPAATITESLTLGTEQTAYLHFHYLKCELAALSATDYEQSDNLVARLNLMNMQWNPEDKVRLYAQAIRGLLNLDNNQMRHAKYLDFIDSYAALTDNERMQYEQQFSQESEAMTGIVSRAREEGMQQGIEQGMQRGMEQGIEQGISQGEVRGAAKGERTILERQLKRRFGELDASTRQRLDEATTEELEQWAENIIEAGSLDEVFTQH